MRTFRQGIDAATLAIGSALLIFATGLAAEPALKVPIGPNGLPTTLVGEAATVALAFTLPAILAGAYLGARRLAQALGLRGALALATLAIIAAFASVVVEHRPDLLPRFAGL